MRMRILMGCACVLAGMFLRSAFASQAVEPATLVCDLAPRAGSGANLELPDTHYFVSERYGWFDRSHFEAGDPEQLLADVHRLARSGGGILMVQQGVRDDLVGYTAAYRISNRLTERDAVGAALGIYLDWSVRFEEWQGRPPLSLVGPLTPFGLEDLPSQYLGFFAAVQGIPVADVFACYLGSVAGSDEGPPDFVESDETAAADGWAGIARLQNPGFAPLVETETGWQTVAWPPALQMYAVSAGPHTWQYLAETTWYLDDPPENPVVADAPLQPSGMADFGP